MQIIVLLLQMIDDCVFSFDRQCERGVYYITINSLSVSATITQVEKQEERLWSNSWTAIALTVNLVCAWLDNKIYHRFTRAVESGFKMAIVNKLQLLSIKYHNTTRSGKILSKLVSDVQFIGQLIYENANDGQNYHRLGRAFPVPL